MCVDVQGLCGPVSDGDHLNLKACSLGEEYLFLLRISQIEGRGGRGDVSVH